MFRVVLGKRFLAALGMTSCVMMLRDYEKVYFFYFLIVRVYLFIEKIDEETGADYFFIYFRSYAVGRNQLV